MMVMMSVVAVMCLGVMPLVRRTTTKRMIAPMTALMTSGDEACADIDAKSGQQVARDRCADEANDGVADQAQTTGFDDETSEPTCACTYD